MTLWIPLTEQHVDLLVTSAQRESLLARPNRGLGNDPLTLAMAEVTERLRLAILEPGANPLSEDKAKLPPEIISTAAMLCLGALDGELPGFDLNEDQLTMLDISLGRMADIASGRLPVSKPSSPQAASLVRRTAGVAIERRRACRLTAPRLAGL